MDLRLQFAASTQTSREVIGRASRADERVSHAHERCWKVPPLDGAAPDTRAAAGCPAVCCAVRGAGAAGSAQRRRRRADELRAHVSRGRRRHRHVPAQQRPALRRAARRPRRSSSCSTPSTTARQSHRRDRRGRAVRVVADSSTSGSAASCRRATAPTSTARTTRTTGPSTPTASRTAIRSSPPGRDNGVMYWGQFGKVKLSGGVFDGASATGDQHGPGRGPRAGRLLGRRGRLLPERHLLRRQEPARHRRRRAGAGRATSGLERSTSCSRRRSATAARSRSRAEYAQYDELGGYNARYGESDGGYVLGQLPVPASRRACRQVPAARQVRARRTSRKGLTPLDPDYDQKTTEINFNYIIKEFNARVMFFFKNTALRRRDDRTSSRSASACRSRCKMVSG